MNLIAHQRPQGLVDQLVSGDRSFALELCGHHNGGIVRIVIAHHLDVGVVEPGFNELAYVGWIHGYISVKVKSWARSVPVKIQPSQRRALFVYDIRP